MDTLFNRLVKLGNRNPGLRDDIAPVLHHLEESRSKTAGENLFAVTSNDGYLFYADRSKRMARDYLRRESPGMGAEVVKLEDVPEDKAEELIDYTRDNSMAAYSDGYEAWQAALPHYNE